MTAGNLHDWSSWQVLRRLALVALWLSTAVGGMAVAGETWRCAAGAATAYRQDPGTGRWKTLVIPVADQRFLVRRAAAPGRWELSWEGRGPATLACTGDFDAAGRLRCGSGDQFEMSRKTLIFESHLFSTGNAGLIGLTALTAVGACTPL